MSLTKIKQIDGLQDNIDLIESLPWTLNHVVPKNNFDTSTHSPTPTALFIRDDGLKMYVGDFTNKKVFQYTLSTAWDISSASFDSKEFDTSSQVTTGLQGVWLSTDGLKMFIVASLPKKIFEYDLSVAFDISTATFNSVSLDVTAQGSARDIFFREDGLRFFLAEPTGIEIDQYSLTVAYDLSTASYDSISFDVSPEMSSVMDVFFKDDGLKMFVVDVVVGIVFQYTLSTAWDISTAYFDNIQFDTLATAINALFFKKHGATFYVADNTTDQIQAFEVATQDDNPFTDDEKTTLDINTARFDVAQEYTATQNFNATTLTDAANISWDASVNQVTSVTLAGNRTLDNPTNLVDGATYIIIIKQDGTGTRTLAYGSAYKFPGGNAPVLSTGINDVDIISFVCDGTNMFGVAQLDFS